MIRPLVLALAGMLLATLPTAARAQDVDVAKMQKQYEEKVAESWFTSNGFTDDYAVAKAKAVETGKPIFAYFSRSYAP